MADQDNTTTTTTTSSFDALPRPPPERGLGPAPGTVSEGGIHYQLRGPADGPLCVLIQRYGNLSPAAVETTAVDES